MIELSISTKSPVAAPPATPVAGGAPGGFARAFDALSDAPPPQQGAADVRHDDAAPGKELPAAETASTKDAAATAATNMAKPAVARRHPRQGDVPLRTPEPVSVASPDGGTTPAASDDKTSDRDAPAAPSPDLMVPVITAPPIMIDPGSLAVSGDSAAVVATTGDAGPRNAIGASLTPSSAASPVALDPNIAIAAGSAMPVAAAPGATPFPAGFELLDPGAARASIAPADPVAVAAPRIVANNETPHFAVAPAAPTGGAVPSVVQPARQAFAAALAALTVRAPTRDERVADSSSPLPIAGITAPTAETLLHSAVQQVTDGAQAALDPRQDRGLHGMIDHIEMLRDDANARDTRIRLMPDALGTVDVAVRREGDAVHVRFSSANEATRLVLGDAQPRLAALAEARGLRIAGSSIDGGQAGGGNQPQPQPRIEPVRRARAPRAAAAPDDDAHSDQRLA